MEKLVSLLETMLASPIFWGVIAFIALAFTASGRFSVTAATICLWIAWGAAAFGLYRAEIIIKIDPLLRFLILVSGAGLLAIGVVLLGRWFVQPKQGMPQIVQETPIDHASQDAKQSDLHLSIEQVGVGSHIGRKGSAILVTASVRNSGSPSIAEGYALFVEIPGRPAILATPTFIDPNKPITMDLPEHTVEISSRDMLYDKTINPIPNGAKIPGYLSFMVDDLSPAQARTKGVVYRLTCKDINQKEISATFIWTDRPLDVIQYFPGLQPPKLISKLKPYVPKAAPKSSPASPPSVPMQTTLRLAEGGQVESLDAEYPFAYRVVMQTDKVVQHVAFVIECDKKPDKVSASSMSGGVTNNVRAGWEAVSSQNYAVEWDSPALTPTNPIVVIVYGRKELVSVKNIRLEDHIPW